MRILIIDDESLIRQSLAYVAKKKGYLCQTASTGKEGLSIWKTWKPDLVFLDITLPDSNGFSIAKQAPFSKIAFMSAHRQNVQQIQHNDLSLFLNKPFSNIFQTFDQTITYWNLQSPSAEL